MARIRTLKPEHKAHRKIGPLSDRDYRLWVGMLTEADDEGRLVADAAQLRMIVFGYHPTVRLEHVEAAILRLNTTGLIHLYAAGGIRYAVFPSWRDHQALDRPRKSNYPSPLHSSNGHRRLDEPSTESRDPSTGIETIRDETKRDDPRRASLDGSSIPDVALPLGPTSPPDPKDPHPVSMAMSDAWRREHRASLRAHGLPPAQADTQAGRLTALDVAYYRSHGQRRPMTNP